MKVISFFDSQRLRGVKGVEIVRLPDTVFETVRNRVMDTVRNPEAATMLARLALGETMMRAGHGAAVVVPAKWPETFKRRLVRLAPSYGVVPATVSRGRITPIS